MDNMELNNGVGVEETKSEPVQEPGEKLFTQEQVNEIVKKRLERQKESNVSMQEMTAREADLTARESRLNCREYLLEKGYPSELLDVIDTTDVEAFKEKADKASGVFQGIYQSQNVAPLASTEPPMHDAVGSAFENTKHTPKPFPPR